MDDESDRRVEYLDDWDPDVPPEPRRTVNTRLLVPFALVIVVAVVVMLAIGGAGRGALNSVALQTPTSSPTVYQPVDMASESMFTPAPPSDDVEALPLVVSLAESVPRTPDGILSFRVSVCVSATMGSAAGGRVPILRNFWTLVSRSTNELLSPMGYGGIDPVFPGEWYYLKGQCASGYISFQTSSGFVPQILAYQDNRFAWSWRVA
jgi:hypothetical protein